MGAVAEGMMRNSHNQTTWPDSGRILLVYCSCNVLNATYKHVLNMMCEDVLNAMYEYVLNSMYEYVLNAMYEDVLNAMY